MNLNPSKLPPTFQILLFSIFASFALSAWGAYAQQIPNPDAMYYLRAAELFQEGRWEEALKVYRWPFYSMTIAAVMSATSASAFVGAQLINALFDGLIVVIFISLLRILTSDKPSNRTIIFWAAALILLHPRLTAIRPLVIRDHGFHAFSLAAIYFIAKDHQHPRLLNKIACCGSIILAALFRLEALYLLVIAPTFYMFTRASSGRTKLFAASLLLLACVVLIPAATIWTSDTIIPQALNKTLTFSVALAPLSHLAEAIAATAAKFQSILPPGRNAGGLSYAGTVAALTIDGTLRAITLPIAVLALFCFVPRRLASPFTTNLVAWFVGWHLPLLLVFTTINLFLDWRYAAILAFLLAIPATYTVYDAAGEARHGTTGKRMLFIAALLALIVPWLLALPRPSHLEHLREAGLWIGDNLPKDTMVFVNDGRLAYYSGRPYDTTVAIPTLANIDWPVSSYAALEIRGSPSSKLLAEDMQQRLLKIIQGSGDRRVYIYKPN